MYFGGFNVVDYDEALFRKEIKRLYDIESFSSITLYKSILGLYGKTKKQLFTDGEFVSCAGFKMNDTQVDSAINVMKRLEVEYFCNKSSEYRNRQGDKVTYKVLHHKELNVINQALKQNIR